MVSVSLAVSVLQLIQMASKSSAAGLDNFGFDSQISRRGAASRRTSAKPATEARNLMKFFVMRSGTGCCLLHQNQKSVKLIPISHVKTIQKVSLGMIY